MISWREHSSRTTALPIVPVAPTTMIFMMLNLLEREQLTGIARPE
jgi:hypothetical protein